MDRGAWWVIVHGVTESDTIDTFTFHSLLLPCVCLDLNPASISMACVTLRKLFTLLFLTPLHEKYMNYSLLKFSSNLLLLLLLRRLSCVRLCATP